MKTKSANLSTIFHVHTLKQNKVKTKKFAQFYLKSEEIEWITFKI